MNFGMLKNMVENLLTTYKCPFCGGTDIWEKHIDIVWAAWNTVNIDMHCPSCKKHFMAKTEVMQMELGNMSADKIAQIQKSLLALKWKLGWNIDISAEVQQESQQESTQDSIKEEHILDIMKSMKKRGMTAEDLFSDTDTSWEDLS